MSTLQIESIGLFWAKVDRSAGPDGCWPYKGFIKWDGYGWVQRYIDGKPKNMTAHRFAWILTNGQPPEGMHLLHICDNPPCCNPAHLKLGTHHDNMADMLVKGRTRNGRDEKPLLHPGRVRPTRRTA